MIISFWRYSHLALAVSSFLLLIAASVSGIVLAFEPINQKLDTYKISGADTISVAQTIGIIKNNFSDIQAVTTDDNQFVTAHFTDTVGVNQVVFINPLSAEIIGKPKKQNPLFEWMTNFHRSLFLKNTGRAIVGVVSFLLILSVISGIFLIIQRQKGIKRFFSKIEKTSFNQYNHVVFGRLFLIFILAIALTGAYLSAYRFFLEEKKPVLVIDESKLTEEPLLTLENFPIFKQIKLNNIKKLSFPFSDFPEDYFTIETADKLIAVNQFTGDILAQQSFSKTFQLANFSLRWHTGRTSIVWAIVLMIATLYILFFIYSGFAISLKRMSGTVKNKYKSRDCSIIILVGSENGKTYLFAKSVYKQLINFGYKVYLTDLNNYQKFPKAKQLLVFSSTYGEGDAPSNGNKFLELLHKIPQSQTIQYSILGFGSRSYKHYCKFAYDMQNGFKNQSWASEAMSIKTVDDGSLEDFSVWIKEWSEMIHQVLFVDEPALSSKKNLHKFIVSHKSNLTDSNDFIISFSTNKRSKILSGDLLVVYPKDDHRERLYSIGVYNNQLNIVVKKHQYGIGSNYLHDLIIGDTIQARVVKNTHFRLPKAKKNLVLISNGTGIGPFLGMINENTHHKNINLYCGFRLIESFKAYEKIINNFLKLGKLDKVVVAYSRVENKKYVYHLLLDDEENIWSKLSIGATFMICGSLNMYKDVMNSLDEICKKNNSSISFFVNKDQIIHDCY